MSSKNQSDEAGREQVRTDLGLAERPSDELLALLAAVGDEDVVSSPAIAQPSREYTPAEIAEIVYITGSVGDLLAHARAEAEVTLAAVGEAAGVTRARVQQLERSENVELATLVRIAGACGYRVNITLEPVAKEARRALSTSLFMDPGSVPAARAVPRAVPRAAR